MTCEGLHCTSKHLIHREQFLGHHRLSGLLLGNSLVKDEGNSGVEELGRYYRTSLRL